MSDQITVEVAFALPDRQDLVEILVRDGTTAADAVAQSRVLEGVHPDARSLLRLGVWGSVVEPGYRVKAGDRVEVYRPLEIEPREARRRLAGSGQTMRQGTANGSEG